MAGIEPAHLRIPATAVECNQLPLCCVFLSMRKLAHIEMAARAEKREIQKAERGYFVAKAKLGTTALHQGRR
jgi:hypothetical protein